MSFGFFFLASFMLKNKTTPKLVKTKGCAPSPDGIHPEQHRCKEQLGGETEGSMELDPSFISLSLSHAVADLLIIALNERRAKAVTVESQGKWPCHF